MTQSALAAALAAILCAPLAAQPPRGDAEIVHPEQPAASIPSAGPSPCGDAEFLRDLEAGRVQLQQNPIVLQTGKAPAPAKPSREDGLKSTLAAMGDGITVGGIIKDRLEADNVKIEFKTQSAASSRSSDGKTISLSDSLPAAPRVLAPSIAREMAESLLAGIPASAEKEYMRASYMSRVWLELGGEKDKLPAMETLKEYYHEDAAFAAVFKLWRKDEGAAPFVTTASPKLAALRSQKGADTAAIDKALAAFSAFVTAEKDWKLINSATSTY